MRLIDADALIENIGEIVPSTDYYEFASQICNAIRNQPTAYDVEKVVAELEEKSLKCKMEAASIFCEKDYRNNTLKQYVKQSNDMKAFAYDMAIDIVKRGGVE